MNADERRDKINKITERIICGAYNVSNGLGCGFNEKIYENALMHELKKLNLAAQQQYPVTVYYDGIVVRNFKPDMFVEQQVLVELKATKGLTDDDFAQCMNYLKATGLTICLLLNFGRPKLEIKRIVHQF